VLLRAAVCVSRVIDNRPLFLCNYGARGNRALLVAGGAWLVESTATGDLVIKSTASGSVEQELNSNREFISLVIRTALLRTDV
jgi:hypothetical protein